MKLIGKQITLRLIALAGVVSMSALGLANIDIICQISPTASASDVAKSYGISLIAQAPGSPFYLMRASQDQADSVETAMETDARIAWFDEDGDVPEPDAGDTSKGSTVPVIGTVGKLHFMNKAALAQVRWTPALAATAKTHVRVAVLDTGVSPRATTLCSQVVYWNSTLGPGTTPYDSPDPRYRLTAPQNYGVGHGTMVAGLIAMVDQNADLLIERVADSSGKASYWSIICGLTDAVSHNAQLVNISLGAQRPVISFEQVFQWASSKGVIILAPIGNDAKLGTLCPASLEGVICVSGVDATDSKALFSNWDKRSVVAAPAVNIKSVNWDDRVYQWSGTSFSVPLVTGSVALAISNSGPVSSEVVLAALRRSGDSIDSMNPAYKGLLGKRLNCQNLITTLRSPSNSP